MNIVTDFLSALSPNLQHWDALLLNISLTKQITSCSWGIHAVLWLGDSFETLPLYYFWGGLILDSQHVVVRRPKEEAFSVNRF